MDVGNVPITGTALLLGSQSDNKDRSHSEKKCWQGRAVSTDNAVTNFAGCSPQSVTGKVADKEFRVCHCGVDAARRSCLRGAFFLPEVLEKDDTSYIHIPEKGIDPRRVGREMECPDLSLILNQNLKKRKGQVLASTPLRCFGYPVIALTVELADNPDRLASLEIVTAPLTALQHEQILPELNRLVAQMESGHRLVSIEQLVTRFNQEAKNTLLHLELAKSDEFLSSKCNIDAFMYENKDGSSLSFDSNKKVDDEKLLHKTVVRNYEVDNCRWCNQSNFFIPFSNVEKLPELVGFYDDVTAEQKVFNEDQVRVEDASALTDSLFSYIEEKIAMPGQPGCVKSLLTHFSKIALLYHYCFAISEIQGKHYLNGPRYTLTSIRVSQQQIIMQILGEADFAWLCSFFTSTSHIDLLIVVTDFFNKQGYKIGRSDLRSLFNKWIMGYWLDVYGCLNLRKSYGKLNVHSANTPQHYVKPGQQIINLPTHSAQAVREIVDPIRHFYYLFDPVLIDGEPWIVVEFRSHRYNSYDRKGINHIPFNFNSTWPSSPSSIEQRMADCFWYGVDVEENAVKDELLKPGHRGESD